MSNHPSKLGEEKEIYHISQSETVHESEALICVLMDHLFAFHFPWREKMSCVNLCHFECSVRICGYLKSCTCNKYIRISKLHNWFLFQNRNLSTK